MEPAATQGARVRACHHMMSTKPQMQESRTRRLTKGHWPCVGAPLTSAGSQPSSASPAGRAAGMRGSVLVARWPSIGLAVHYSKPGADATRAGASGLEQAASAGVWRRGRGAWLGPGSRRPHQAIAKEDDLAPCSFTVSINGVPCSFIVAWVSWPHAKHPQGSA